MATYAYPAFGDRRVDQIRREDVLRVLTPIWSSKHALAVKVRGRIRALLSWCQAHDYVEHNAAGEGIDGALRRWRPSRRITGRSTTARSRRLSTVAELALAHQVGSAVERSYARSDLFEKRRGLMNAWARYVTDDRAKVVRLGRAST
jgi:hypothetical protein